MEYQLVSSGISYHNFGLPQRDSCKNYILRKDDGISKEIKQTGYYDKTYTDICEKLIRPNSTVLDIGANLGSWVVEESIRCPSVTFHAFEPQKMTYYQLCGNLFINNCTNVTSHNCALTSDPAKKTMLFCINHPSNNGGSRLECENRRAPIGYINTEWVPTRTLDSLGLSDISFIKIDVEGHEQSVIEGGVETLKRSGWPTIGFECWDEPGYEHIKIPLIKYVRELGYICSKVYPSSYMGIHESNLLKPFENSENVSLANLMNQGIVKVYGV
jgi:FkbM family methyltransferase